MEQIPHWVSDEELADLATRSDDPLVRRLGVLIEALQATVKSLEQELEELSP